MVACFKVFQFVSEGEISMTKVFIIKHTTHPRSRLGWLSDQDEHRSLSRVSGHSAARLVQAAYEALRK